MKIKISNTQLKTAVSKKHEIIGLIKRINERNDNEYTKIKK